MYGVIARNSAAQVSILLKSGRTLFLYLRLKTLLSVTLHKSAIFLSEKPNDLMFNKSSEFRGSPFNFNFFSATTILLI